MIFEPRTLECGRTVVLFQEFLIKDSLEGFKNFTISALFSSSSEAML
jgi:hypothetical protein